MGLEEILKELGSETPFDETGDLTSEGAAHLINYYGL